MKELVIAVGLLGLAILIALIQPQLPRVPFETIALGEESGIRTQEALVITDQAGWEELWQQHMSYSHNPLPLPQVDFAKEMVIAVFGGIKPEGYMLQIIKIEQGGREIGGPLYLSRPLPLQVFSVHGDDPALSHREAGTARAAGNIPQRLALLL